MTFRLRNKIALYSAKVVRFLLRFANRNGTSFPGKIALFIDNSFLDVINEKCNSIILITGTNGKTTTNNLINHILRDIINTVNTDSADKESKNTISFCSKFLHFLCPDTVFIKDSISLSKGSNIFKNLYRHSSLKPLNKMVSCSDIELTFIGAKEKNAIEEYIAHVNRAYSVAKFLHDKQKICTPQIASSPQHSRYMTRLVDSIFMNYKI